MDFEKACELVSWSFLDYMFFTFGFDDKWRVWMHACMVYGMILFPLGMGIKLFPLSTKVYLLVFELHLLVERNLTF